MAPSIPPMAYKWLQLVDPKLTTELFSQSFFFFFFFKTVSYCATTTGLELTEIPTWLCLPSAEIKICAPLGLAVFSLVSLSQLYGMDRIYLVYSPCLNRTLKMRVSKEARWHMPLIPAHYLKLSLEIFHFTYVKKNLAEVGCSPITPFSGFGSQPELQSETVSQTKY